MLSELFRRSGLCDNPIWLPMTRRDIGDYLGLTTETASRMFTQLERFGAITKLSDARIDLTNRPMLQEIAEGG
jgi:CRP/FNR family transcriptional regulator